MVFEVVVPIRAMILVILILTQVLVQHVPGVEWIGVRILAIMDSMRMITDGDLDEWKEQEEGSNDT